MAPVACPKCSVVVFDQLILFSENLNQNASLGHFIGVALAPLAKPETNSKLLDVLLFGYNLFFGKRWFDKGAKR